MWGPKAPRQFFGPRYWSEPEKWNRRAEVVEERIRGDLWECMGTDRGDYERPRVFCGLMCDVFEDRRDLDESRARLWGLIDKTPALNWLLLTKRPENIRRLYGETMRRNVWLGTSAEDQKCWDARVPVLLGVPAMVHFVSAEPLLGPIVMGAARPDWVIVGGESGPRWRPMEAGWVRALRDECEGRTAFFFKQWGGVRKNAAGRELDGRIFGEVPEELDR